MVWTIYFAKALSNLSLHRTIVKQFCAINKQLAHTLFPVYHRFQQFDISNKKRLCKSCFANVLRKNCKIHLLNFILIGFRECARNFSCVCNWCLLLWKDLNFCFYQRSYYWSFYSDLKHCKSTQQDGFTIHASNTKVFFCPQVSFGAKPTSID